MSKVNSKKIKKSDLGVTLLLIIGILGVVSFFSYQFFYRWDLTENKIFSISDVSKNAARNLDDIVNIKAYFSSNIPNQVLYLRQEVKDLLEEYQNYSNGKIHVEFIDPQSDEETQRELAAIGIPQLTFEVYEQDKRQLVNGYMGIAVSYGGKTEVIPAIKRNTSDLEYQITTAIKKVTVGEIATIGYLSSQNTLDLNNQLQIARQQLEEIYDVREIRFNSENPEVPQDIDTLLIVGPKDKFTEEDLKAINDFLKRGGALLLALDGVKIGDGLLATKNETDINTLLTKYGLRINQDLVADLRSGTASFSQGFISFSTNYPFWPAVRNDQYYGDGFNRENNAVANLEQVIFPWVSSVDILPDKLKAESAVVLAHSTDKAWHLTDNFNVAPQQAMTPKKDQQQFDFVVFYNGELKDAYPQEGNEAESFNSRIILVGDSDFVKNDFVRNNPDNLTLFQNLVDLLSFDSDLINIRSKAATTRPIKDGLTDKEKAIIRYLNVFGLTVIVVFYGIIRYFLRRRSRFVDDL